MYSYPHYSVLCFLYLHPSSHCSNQTLSTLPFRTPSLSNSPVSPLYRILLSPPYFNRNLTISSPKNTTWKVHETISFLNSEPEIQEPPPPLLDPYSNPYPHVKITLLLRLLSLHLMLLSISIWCCYVQTSWLYSLRFGLTVHHYPNSSSSSQGISLSFGYSHFSILVHPWLYC